MYRKYKGKRFELLSINTDTDKAAAAKVVRELKLEFPVLEGAELVKVYDVKGNPMNFIIDGQGRLRYRRAGYKIGDEKRHALVVEEFLNQKSSN